MGFLIGQLKEQIAGSIFHRTLILRGGNLLGAFRTCQARANQVVSLLLVSVLNQVFAAF